ncbi:uncharacterized protein [Primulina huaijiensis]|uniref:uncharacterized protein isoform X1 n=1 Tax=Primulina huaijiensis TaxID=1492673 RepID=UPI003CC773DE
MRATAANVAGRAATGVGDMMLRWQLMIEAKQKLGGTETLSGSQSGKEVAWMPSPTSTRNTKENQEAEKRDHSQALSTPASVRKVARNRIVMPQPQSDLELKGANMKVCPGISVDIQMMIRDHNAVRFDVLNDLLSFLSDSVGDSFVGIIVDVEVRKDNGKKSPSYRCICLYYDLCKFSNPPHGCILRYSQGNAW